jgi:uncharacterized membrane protein (DUF106 family)
MGLEFLKEWMMANPKTSVIVISALITLVMTLVTKKFTNQTRMKELKDVQKSHQARIKEHKGNMEKISEIQKEMMEGSLELMKHSFKPMFITFIPLILIFWWIRGVYVETALASAWIWWYIGAGILSSIIFRKMFKVV